MLIEGTVGLTLRLLYGVGMRVVECLCLRVKDVDFARSEIPVREGKGFKDRVGSSGCGHDEDVRARVQPRRSRRSQSARRSGAGWRRAGLTSYNL